MIRSIKNYHQAGFTLMEVVVATAIFATSLTLMLSLFVYTLKTNRRVEALRQASQATRNFTEYLLREVRNGQIDYSGSIDSADCPAPYDPKTNQTLALVSRSGDRECFFLADKTTTTANLKVYRRSVTGSFVTEQLNPPNATLDPTTFRLLIRPTADPRVMSGSVFPGVQPMVTIIMNLTVRVGDAVSVIPYQTTVSTDVYDLPHH